MRFSRKITLLTGLLSLGAIIEGCGGPQLVRTKPVEMAIPPELAKAFEVKEIPTVSAASISTPAADAGIGNHSRRHPGRKKRERKKKLISTTAAEPSLAAIGGPGKPGFKIPNRRPVPDPIWVGEKVWMDVTWLNTKAGEFELEVLPFKEINGRKVYDLKGSARTSDLFSLVYKAEDWVESFVDHEGWFPYKFVLHGDETKHIRNNVELFDHVLKKQFVATYDNRIQKDEVVEEKGFKDLTPLSQDSLSAIYYVRTLKFEEGKVLRFPMTTNGNQWETEVSVLGREDVSTKMGDMKAFKTKIETRFKGVLQQQGDAFMWFSDDERKYLLRFEAKVRIGWIAGITKRIEPGLSAEMPVQPGRVAPPVASPPASVPNEGSANKDQTSSNENPPGKRRVWFHQLLERLSAMKKE